MKNLVFTLFIATVLFSSCSKEESAANTLIPPVSSVKRISETSYYNGIPNTFVVNFNYENGQLKNLTDDTNASFEFVMEGNKIVQVKYMANNVVTDVNNVTYVGNNLTKIQQGDNGGKTEFTYINGQLATETFSYSSSNGPWILSTLNNYVYNSNQNIESRFSTFYQGSNQVNKTSYQYDSKNSVFKNMNPYLKFLLIFGTFDNNSNNNVLKQFSHPTPTSTVTNQTHYSTIIYNGNNFPISIKRYGFVNNDLISECTISYN